MQLKHLTILSILSLINADGNSANVEFLTDLVNDYKSHTSDYINFIRTADTVPAALTSLAVEVATYTDDSYTTMLSNSGINVASLKSFATELPWYSRIADVAEDSSDSDSSSSDSGSSSSAGSSSGESTSSDDGVAKLGVGALLGLAGIALL